MVFLPVFGEQEVGIDTEMALLEGAGKVQHPSYQDIFN
jgi:hypothetical protein